MSVLALLRRTRQENPMPETTTTPATAATPDETDDLVLMRFLTQGGATVELHQQTRNVRTLPGSSTMVMPNGETRISNGFNWRCLGCDAIGGGGRYGLGDRHFDEHQLEEGRREANDHSSTCRAMPRPTA